MFEVNIKAIDVVFILPLILKKLLHITQSKLHFESYKIEHYVSVLNLGLNAYKVSKPGSFSFSCRCGIFTYQGSIKYVNLLVLFVTLNIYIYIYIYISVYIYTFIYICMSAKLNQSYRNYGCILFRKWWQLIFKEQI